MFLSNSNVEDCRVPSLKKETLLIWKVWSLFSILLLYFQGWNIFSLSLWRTERLSSDLQTMLKMLWVFWGWRIFGNFEMCTYSGTEVVKVIKHHLLQNILKGLTVVLAGKPWGKLSFWFIIDTAFVDKIGRQSSWNKAYFKEPWPKFYKCSKEIHS